MKRPFVLFVICMAALSRSSFVKTDDRHQDGYFVDFNAIHIMDGRYLVQRIDGLSTQLLDISLRRPRDGRFVLHFDDLNFDGYMDMALTNFAPNGMWSYGNHYYWLWDPSLSTFGQFVKNETLTDFWGFDAYEDD